MLLASGVGGRRGFPCDHGTHVTVPPGIDSKRVHSPPDATTAISFGSIPSWAGEVVASPWPCGPCTRLGVEADSGAADMYRRTGSSCIEVAPLAATVNSWILPSRA